MKMSARRDWDIRLVSPALVRRGPVAPYLLGH